MQVKIITLVTNIDGVGPGHSAVAVGDQLYTFEDMTGGWFQSNSGWKKLQYEPYLSNNEHRPALIQTIPSANPPSVTKYVNQSIADDDDYGSSGVCSQQVAMAVNYALPKDVIFNPKGFDTPFGVYWCARRLGLVSSEEYLWPGKSSVRFRTWMNIVNKLQSDYPIAADNMDLNP
ncbi:MAG: hypothetical protein DWQ47_16425 [Acidobacteria bacterium]|nr:MAG: hypothetical protein DWQ32_03825 [Acidobacteriota bacterium]REK02362.1 MAG: hypothetical protein DWQ38_08315 [Acidobacteriota bacterium]REK13836.1 MAG: hypothetical protein DWQ43_09515 [Acidobacteriota bacterium]REK41831.1 MAG: hypothetical protein DWQ47_16425 [Acidobacteriota bacterium]